MRKTMEMFEAADKRPGIAGREGLSAEHLRSMMTLVEEMLAPGGCGMSDAKLGRWLGWMQCAVVATTDLELEDMKELNVELSLD
jgi:hypothetical protein